jgi:hypothetical protein
MATGCGSAATGGRLGRDAGDGSAPDTRDAAPEQPAPEVAQFPAELRDRLTMFFKMDEVGDGVRVDAVSGVPLVPWQRTGLASYEVSALGTVAVSAVVGDGQHIQGSVGYHFSTGSAPAMKHEGESFTWAGWVSVDAAAGDPPYTDAQTLVAKWNGMPDTFAANDHREYRVWHDHDMSRWRFEVSSDGLEGSGHSQIVTHPTRVERDRYYFVEAWHDAERDSIALRVSTQSERGVAESVAWSDGVFSGDADLNVGAQNTCTDDHLQGIIDALGYWNRTLSDAESERSARTAQPAEYPNKGTAARSLRDLGAADPFSVRDREPSMRLVPPLDHEPRRRCVYPVHGGPAVVDAREHRLHVLREAERRLRERIEPG